MAEFVKNGARLKCNQSNTTGILTIPDRGSETGTGAQTALALDAVPEENIPSFGICKSGNYKKSFKAVSYVNSQPCVLDLLDHWYRYEKGGESQLGNAALRMASNSYATAFSELVAFCEKPYNSVYNLPRLIKIGTNFITDTENKQYWNEVDGKYSKNAVVAEQREKIEEYRKNFRQYMPESDKGNIISDTSDQEKQRLNNIKTLVTGLRDAVDKIYAQYEGKKDRDGIPFDDYMSKQPKETAEKAVKLYEEAQVCYSLLGQYQQEKNYQENANRLTTDSVLVCRCGGIIRIDSPGENVYDMNGIEANRSGMFMSDALKSANTHDGVDLVIRINGERRMDAVWDKDTQMHYVLYEKDLVKLLFYLGIFDPAEIELLNFLLSDIGEKTQQDEENLEAARLLANYEQLRYLSVQQIFKKAGLSFPQNNHADNYNLEMPSTTNNFASRWANELASKLPDMASETMNAIYKQAEDMLAVGYEADFKTLPILFPGGVVRFGVKVRGIIGKSSDVVTLNEYKQRNILTSDMWQDAVNTLKDVSIKFGGATFNVPLSSAADPSVTIPLGEHGGAITLALKGGLAYTHEITENFSVSAFYKATDYGVQVTLLASYVIGVAENFKLRISFYTRVTFFKQIHGKSRLNTAQLVDIASHKWHYVQLLSAWQLSRCGDISAVEAAIANQMTVQFRDLMRETMAMLAILFLLVVPYAAGEILAAAPEAWYALNEFVQFADKASPVQ